MALEPLVPRSLKKARQLPGLSRMVYPSLSGRHRHCPGSKIAPTCQTSGAVVDGIHQEWERNSSCPFDRRRGSGLEACAYVNF